ncbi:MAG: BsuBI/PstI family type II restriction endonuclease [Bacteroidota bacterium]|nr:BsuBI/PstI family type II restriction endonuclease [Bacteroidota bacterium]
MRLFYLRSNLFHTLFLGAGVRSSEFKRHTSNIAWDTEVWIMEFPEHMIHFNGDRFLGPR